MVCFVCGSQLLAVPGDARQGSESKLSADMLKGFPEFPPPAPPMREEGGGASDEIGRSPGEMGVATL